MIGSLTARIFAIFWLTLALVLMLVLMLPKLDSRQMTELLDSEQRQGLMIEQHVEAELANDPPNDLMWWRRLFRAIDKWAPPGQRLLLVTTEGRVIGAERSEMQIIRNFIGQADNADHPQKKKYGRVELVGPFSVRDGEDNYQLYLIRPASSSQSDFINLLFDRPLLLLIVTMLVSTPLLLWLAWSLAKPARKLKNAADEVAQGNLRQHPELEAGPQEFLAAGASFNQMVTALERMMTSQQRLLSDISHELRTPLAVIRANAGAAARQPDQTQRYLAVIDGEARRMGALVDEVASYRNSASAIGYSVYYYVTEMYLREGVKLLAIDGVAPSNETIASGEYPYTQYNYAVIRKDEKENSPARQLFDFLTTPEGKALMAAQGYVPAA